MMKMMMLLFFSRRFMALKNISGISIRLFAKVVAKMENFFFCII